MFIAAFVAAQHDPDTRAYYLRKQAESKHHNTAVTCVARRRPNIIASPNHARPRHAQNPNPLPTTPEKLPRAA